ncbi:MAG: alpha-glucan family phosphorylase [Dehalococcoidia bacterium]|nr:alpha-glucan family phosphorylase [Dehalococcoidia bacterium]
MLQESKIPERISRLEELANNLWWSWHTQARALFRTLDYPLWRLSGHNPVRQLHEISSDKLAAAVADPAFIKLYDSVMSAFDADMSDRGSWFSGKYPNVLHGPVAYFSMEFAIHNSLPIYAGGLGVLAGDTCKEASDLGLPLVGVGFMYPQGYFHQHISAEGWQEEHYSQLDFDEAPINPVNPVHRSKWCGPLVQIRLGDRLSHIGVWQVRLGRVNLYLMCCDVEGNIPEDQQLCARLYTADPEQRIQQEIVLGIGGVRVLRALGIKPSVWHANEGHCAFMMLERVREEMERGASFAEALRNVQAATVFTTHTQVAAGHDIFPVSLVEKYFRTYWESTGINRETFLELGRQDGASDQAFNMTVLGLKMAGHRNAVSQIHGRITRKMWHGLWPEVKEDEVPISHITNGIHTPTWVAREMGGVYEKHLGHDVSKRYDDTTLQELVINIPDEELWAVHQVLKRKLIGAMVERARQCSTERECKARQVLAMGSLLDQDTLTIGFVRRFAAYKRPELVFHDTERLKRIVTDRWHPVQIIFAGKSHPADLPSKQLLHDVYTLATNREFQGRIAFVEDYDIHMAHYLVQGVDVWLNTPRRHYEACGTSGMKAAGNGVLHLSVRGGWWHEGYNGANGWVIQDEVEAHDPGEEDTSDAKTLYRLLEEEIVPLYYQRDRNGVPHGWVHMVKEAINSIVPRFCARRMLKEYIEQMYIPAARK